MLDMDPDVKTFEVESLFLWVFCWFYHISPEKNTLYLEGLYPEVYVFHGFGIKSLKPKSRPFDFVAAILTIMS